MPPGQPRPTGPTGAAHRARTGWPPPFPDLPAAGAGAEVVLPRIGGLPCHVLRVDGPALTLVAPGGVTLDAAALGPGAAGPAGRGTAPVLTLRWAGERGRHAVPARFVHTDPNGPTWVVEAVGTVEVQQRRLLPRAAADQPVLLGAADPAVPVVLGGRLADISEGGLRCRLAAGGLDPAQPVWVRLVLDSRLVTLGATVVRWERDERGAEVDVAVAFDPAGRPAEVVRRLVRLGQPLDRTA